MWWSNISLLSAVLTFAAAQLRPDYHSTDLGGGNLLTKDYARCSQGCKCFPSGYSPTYVDCSKTGAEVIPHDLPPSTSSLFLDGNNIRMLDSILSQYDRLTTLDVSDNQLSDIAEDAFGSLGVLHFLDLSFNRLSRIGGRTFEGLRSLKSLNLKGNSIEDVDSEAFKSCPDLKQLDLSDNRISSLDPQIFAVVTNVQELVLKGNLLRQVPTRSLSLLSHLSVLDLSDNTLQSLPPSSFSGNQRLSVLSLRGCLLNTLETDSLSGLGGLKKLDLSSNHLARMPANAFPELAHLEELHIGLNFIFEIRLRDMEPLTNLRRLVIQGCDRNVPLKIYPDAFSSNTNLVQVNITKCSGLTWLETGTFSLLPFLEVLNLHGSGLERIDSGAADWSTLKWMDLTANRLHCDCNLSFLIRIAKRISGGGEGKEVPGIVCATPKELEDRLLSSLNADGLECDGSEARADDGLSTGELVGMSMGAVLFLSTASVVSCYLCKKGGRKRIRRDGISMDDLSCRLWLCLDHQPRRRLKRPSSAVEKTDIRVETLKVDPPAGYLDVRIPVESELETENLYEVPLGPSTANYPDVKLTML